jgi:hypothetical protein
MAESGPGTAALVELYTSEGCSSCPPADRWLAGLRERHAPGTLVPLALYVHSWANREFSLSQKKLLPLQRLALVFTPLVLLQGRDFRGWGTKAFEQAVARINAQPAKARISLVLLRADQQGLQVETRAEVPPGVPDAALYVAAYQSRVLGHDYVVLEWQGPFPVQGRVVERRTLKLLPSAAAANSGAAAFVQDRASGEVLQALMRSPC